MDENPYESPQIAHEPPAQPARGWRRTLGMAVLFVFGAYGWAWAAWFAYWFAVTGSPP
jgi:hypothetical protein